VVGRTGHAHDRGELVVFADRADLLWGRLSAYLSSPLLGTLLVVKSATQGGPVDNVNATLSGPTTNTLSCEANGTETRRTWSSGALPEGDYLLEVTAPGFQPAMVAATVAFPSGTCGCKAATLQPS